MTDQKHPLQKAMEAWRVVLSSHALISDPHQVEMGIRNVTGLNREAEAILMPSTTDEVLQVVEIANRFQIPLYPVSGGRNWGLGSRMPVTHRCVVVDLNRMNRIREVNVEHHYAVVEPGVTQRQLYQYLCDQRLPLVMNVTGSGADTSLIGNALDRGVGYFAPRAGSLSSLEVVLGNGRLLKTGFGHYPHAVNRHVYPDGIGPSLDGLFFQSNFGIVTCAGVDLIPAPEARVSLVATLRRDDLLEPFMDAMARLAREGIVRSAVHIANRSRTEISMAPLIYQYLSENKPAANPDTLKRESLDIIRREGFGPWSAVGGLFATRAMLRAMQHEIRGALKGIAHVQFISDELLKLGKWASHLLQWIPAMSRKKALLHAVEPLYGLSKGIPSDVALHSVGWPLGELPSREIKNPDEGQAGLLYCLPMIPLSGYRAQQTVLCTESVFVKYGFTPYITMNIVDAKALECVINLAFDRQSPEQVHSAHACIHELESVFMNEGLMLYRVGIDSMNRITSETDPFWQVVRDLKKVLDPQHIIAPRRYNLV
ncbi:MAG: FAD-binding oxidoreductase [Lentisphaerota bacterium]